MKNESEMIKRPNTTEASRALASGGFPPGFCLCFVFLSAWAKVFDAVGGVFEILSGQKFGEVRI